MKPSKARTGTVIVLLLALTPLGCKDEADNVKFEGSACKKDGEQDWHIYPLFTLDSSEPLDGLHCISWSTSGDDTVSVDLINFPGACGASYTGSASVDDPGTLELVVKNPGCMVAGCGMCVYDWSFEVGGLSLGNPIALTVVEDYCPGEGVETVYTTELPVETMPSGMICRYLDSGVLEWVGTCGKLHNLCGGPGASEMCSATSVPCDGDLVCAAPADGTGEICLAPCVTDEDCPLDGGVLTCLDDVCQIASTW